MMVLNEEERLKCEIQVDGIRLKHVSKFKYLECVFDESGTDGINCSRKLVSGRRVAVAIRSLVNQTLFVPVLIYGSETMLWKEKEISRMRAVQMDNLRGLLGIRRMDRVPNTRIREF